LGLHHHKLHDSYPYLCAFKLLDRAYFILLPEPSANWPCHCLGCGWVLFLQPVICPIGDGLGTVYSKIGGHFMTTKCETKKILFFRLMLLLGLMMVNPSWVYASGDKINVVASFSILGDMVAEVAGNKAHITTIVGPDADAHLYQPNAGDAVAVTNADLIIVNGMGFETWSAQLIETSGTKANIVVATDGITPLLVDGEVDPHAWNSLINGMIYVDNIEAALSAISPKNADYFKANADAYRAQLNTLHARALADIASLPEDKRIVVTAHDAFGYLADAYGLTFLAPQGIDTEAEPSAKELAALIAFLKEQNAGALFVENIANADLIEQISRETGIKIGGRIYSDALSVKNAPARSYLAMFAHNLELLTTTLAAAK